MKENLFTLIFCFWAVDISVIKLPYINTCRHEQPQCLCRLIYREGTVSFHSSQKLGYKFHFITNPWHRALSSYFSFPDFHMQCSTTHYLRWEACPQKCVEPTEQIQELYRIKTCTYFYLRVFQETSLSKFIGSFRRRSPYTTIYS